VESKRINRKGETIPSITNYTDLYSGTPWNGGSRGSGYTGPVNRRSLACAYGCDDGDLNDEVGYEAWNAQIERQRKLREERERNATVLSRETSLGNKTTEAILKQAQTQHDLNLYLVQNNRFAIGDKITYSAIAVDSPDLSLNSMGIILAIERDIANVVWPNSTDLPMPYLVLSLHPWVWAQKHADWNGAKYQARWSSVKYHRHLTTNEHTKFFKDNVQLSDYIRQAKDALKAGLVEIQNRA
jgi:hypothetical protein